MLIIRLLWVVNVALILLTWTLTWTVFNDQLGLDVVREIGRKTGVTALIMLGVSFDPWDYEEIASGIGVEQMDYAIPTPAGDHDVFAWVNARCVYFLFTHMVDGETD